MTTPQDIQIVNRYKPEYVGFVFFEKSKRNVSFGEAKGLLDALDDAIIPVAVVVSPTLELIDQLQLLGFPILQVHGNLTDEVAEQWQGDIWQAVNIADGRIPQVRRDAKIKAYVVDGAKYGGGETFGWDDESLRNAFAGLRAEEEIRILAGGLNLQNLKEGMELFRPEVVDVSSGVEGEIGKDEEKVRRFIEIARTN